MKRLFCLIYVAALLLGLCGCESREENSVRFYYLRQEYTAFSQDSVIAPEERELSGRREELDFLLRLYLGGPLEDTHRSPFPAGTQLIRIQQDGEVLTLILTPEFTKLQGVNLTLASACLAFTCFDLTDAATVEIYAGDAGAKPLATMTRGSLTLLDDSTTQTENS